MRLATTNDQRRKGENDGNWCLGGADFRGHARVEFRPAGASPHNPPSGTTLWRRESYSCNKAGY